MTAEHDGRGTDLVRRLKAGDEEVFESLIREQGGRDAVQEAFLSAYGEERARLALRTHGFCREAFGSSDTPVPEDDIPDHLVQAIPRAKKR